ncbi:MAG: hypothetical protein ABI912_02705 [Actinomycetota bacterium]
MVAGLAGLALLATGVWALLSPHSFYDAAATFPPYNRHLLHDLGAFLTGLGSALLLSLRFRRGITVALAANAVAGVLHAVSHIVDRDTGGRASDPALFTVIAVILAVAAVIALREESS